MRPPERPGRLSLTRRLTLFFTAIAALVVLGLGGLFLAETRHHFVELDRMLLDDKRLQVEEILRNAASKDEVRWRLDEALGHHQDMQAVVTDEQQAVVLRSIAPGLQLPLEPAAAADPQPGARHSHRADAASAASAASGEFGTWREDRTEFHTLRFSTTPAHASAPWQVWLATDTRHHEVFLARLGRSLAVYVLAALVVCGLLSWFAARQGLAPLRQMKTRAARVSGRKLTERMPVDAVPVEMADLAQELNRMLDRLQDDFQRLTDVASDLAHELRTPISNLLTQTQVVLATRRDAATYRDTLASNAEEYQRLARMVEDMLFLARTEHGVDLPNRETFPARQQVRTLLDFYEVVADERRIRLELHGDGPIDGDRLMFHRAVSNLLSNALRHTPDGGEVIVRIAADSAPGAADDPGGDGEGAARPGAARPSPERWTTVEVENTGPDLDPMILPRLFDRYYRADQARAHRDSEGSGLGLAITRTIVEAHGGRATVASSGGRTRFRLSFPQPTSIVSRVNRS